MKKIYVKIKLFIIATYIILWTIFLILLGLIIGNKIAKLRVFGIKSFFFLFGLKIKVKGKEDKNATIFIVNHQSFLDIIVLESTIKKKTSFLAKKELFNVPIFKTFLKISEVVPVDRDNKKSIKKLISDCDYFLKKGKALIIFPEGTRTKTFKILPFKMGANFIANKFNLRVQPIVLVNTANTFSKDKINFRGSEVLVHFLEAFDAKKEDNWLEESRIKMQRVYDNELTNNNSYR